MQIHELNMFEGAPGAADFLPIDSGFDTAKIGANSFVLQNSYGNAGQLLRSRGEGLPAEWVDQGLPTDEQTAQAVSDWLDDHPEATTTVLDGSLTNKKLALGTLGFVTPEMFGAVGDGVSDDTDAIQDAIDSAYPVYMGNNYLITDSLTFTSRKVFRCEGTIEYTGAGSAIVISYSFVDIFINELRTSGNGVELRPTSSNDLNACQMDIVNCNRILCTGNNGIGIYINNANGLTQFCKLIVNRLQGGTTIGTNVGIKIVGLSQSTKYCNACIFDIHSICFFDTAILTDTVANSCIEHYFNNVNFEQNNVAINAPNSMFYMTADFYEASAGKIIITDKTVATINVSAINELQFDLSLLNSNLITGTSFDIRGRIYSSNGIYLTDNIKITQLGVFAPNAATPFASVTVLTDVYGSVIMKYVTNGDTLKVPAIRKGNSGAGYVLFMYQIFISSAGGKTGTITLEFSDGSTQTINFTNYDGVITVVPKIGNNGQYGWYQAY